MGWSGFGGFGVNKEFLTVKDEIMIQEQAAIGRKFKEVVDAANNT